MDEQKDYQKPILTIDIVIATLNDGLKFLVMKRKAEPYSDMFGLPGGYVHCDEDTNAQAAAHRILSQKCNMAPFYMEQLATFSGADRDPRGWSATIVYLCILPFTIVQALHDPETMSFVDPEDLPELAFDHAEILHYAAERIRAKASYSMITASFLGSSFTLPQFQAALQQLTGRAFSEASFRRKILSLGVLEEDGYSLATQRPAKLYKVATAEHTFDRSFMQSW